jgi:hypothetical protein
MRALHGQPLTDGAGVVHTAPNPTHQIEATVSTSRDIIGLGSAHPSDRGRRLSVAPGRCVPPARPRSTPKLHPNSDPSLCRPQLVASRTHAASQRSALSVSSPANDPMRSDEPDDHKSATSDITRGTNALVRLSIAPTVISDSPICRARVAQPSGLAMVGRLRSRTRGPAPIGRQPVRANRGCCVINSGCWAQTTR